MRSHHRGVTLIEMLVVIAIISVLAGVLFPAVQNARMSAKRVECANHLKQIGIAMHLHADASKGGLNDRITDPLRTSWRVKLLPFLEELTLVNEYRRSQSWDSPENLLLVPKMPRVFSCPLSNCWESGRSSYDSTNLLFSLTVPPGGPPVWIPDTNQLLDATRQGPSRPMAIELSDEFTSEWTDPNFSNSLVALFWKGRLKQVFGGNHISVFPILFADGHVRFYSTSIDPKPLAEAISGIRDVKELEQ